MRLRTSDATSSQNPTDKDIKEQKIFDIQQKPMYFTKEKIFHKTFYVSTREKQDEEKYLLYLNIILYQNN